MDKGLGVFLPLKKKTNKPSSCGIKILGMNYRKLGIFCVTECRYCSYMTEDLIL